MAKSTNKLIIIFLSTVLIALAFLLFGCNQSLTTEQIQKNLNSFIETENGQGSFLSEDNQFKNFTIYKNQAQPELIDNNYQNLVSIAVNYIEQYSKYFESEENFDYSSIQNNLDLLNNSYQKVLQDYQDFIEVQDSNKIIYNGFALNYQNSSIDFVNNAFSVALSIKECLAENFGLINTNFEESVTVDQANIYLDALRLDIANDYRTFLLISCKGEVFDQNEIYSAVSNQLKSLTNITDILVTEGKNQQFISLKQKTDALSEERNIIKKCLENFSIYDYVEIYDNDIENYQSSINDAKNYLEKIKSYFYNSQNKGALGNIVEQIIKIYE